ncbi:LuxR C-terminal-related transcriptional regulator [Streptomyces sp. NBC_00209]|uniref:LuxR C-terminal-related transcriptional regulator n=1 Tax=Streptomyces sp. NBC_00209 TaxID=2975682 RepID=UPI00324D505F
MQGVFLAGGSTLERNAYEHIINRSRTLTMLGHTATLAEALKEVLCSRPDLLLIDKGTLPPAVLAPPRMVLRQAATLTRLAFIGTVPVGEIASYLRDGVTGILSHEMDTDQFVTGVDLVSRGGVVISPPTIFDAAPPLSPLPIVDRLSAREREILALIPTQPDNESLAQLLRISPLTVKSHVNSILRKLGATSRARLVVIAYESGLVTPGTPGRRHLSGHRDAGPDG